MTRSVLDQQNAEINLIKKERLIKRRLTKDPYLDLRPYATEILRWARCKGASKSIIQELIKRSFHISVSKDRIYRFVVRELGSWPNHRTEKPATASPLGEATQTNEKTEQ